MTDEIERLIAGLRFCAKHALCYSDDEREECPCFQMCNNHDAKVAGIAADMIEKLSAKNDRWKVRCESTESALKALADTVCETYEDDTPCELCKWDGVIGSGELGECPGFHRNDCFEWREAQEEENNECVDQRKGQDAGRARQHLCQILRDRKLENWNVPQGIGRMHCLCCGRKWMQAGNDCPHA